MNPLRAGAAVVLIACATTPAVARAPSCSCDAFGSPVAVGTIAPTLVELSGLVASKTQPVLFAHNDSGDAARFFALSNSNGSILREYRLPGATNVDWEDVAIGPCAAGSCLYFGDIGDNKHVRRNYAVYRVVEPKVTQGEPSDVAFERFGYRFPNDEQHNAEALTTDPKTGRLYLISKAPRGRPSVVYRFPAVLADDMLLEVVATLSVPTPNDQQVTAADVSPCGESLLVRMYNRLVIARVPAGAPFERLFSSPFADVPVAEEAQGESVTFTPNGRGFFTASESPKAAAQLNLSGCQ